MRTKSEPAGLSRYPDLQAAFHREQGFRGCSDCRLGALYRKYEDLVRCRDEETRRFKLANGPQKR